MKKLISICACLIALVTVASAQQNIKPAKAGVTYGKAIDKKKAVSVKSLESSLAKSDTYTGKIEGEVISVCKKKGCFLTLKREETGDPIMVRFTDYGYFVPQDLVGKTVVVEGKAKVKETSVDWQKHYAEDLGKSKEEIEKIKEPKRDISIVADGVLVVK